MGNITYHQVGEPAFNPRTHMLEEENQKIKNKIKNEENQFPQVVLRLPRIHSAASTHAHKWTHNKYMNKYFQKLLALENLKQKEKPQIDYYIINIFLYIICLYPYMNTYVCMSYNIM